MRDLGGVVAALREAMSEGDEAAQRLRLAGNELAECAAALYQVACGANDQSLAMVHQWLRDAVDGIEGLAHAMAAERDRLCDLITYYGGESVDIDSPMTSANMTRGDEAIPSGISHPTDVAAGKATEEPSFPPPREVTGATEHGRLQIESRNGHGVNNEAILDAVSRPVREPQYRPDKYGGHYRFTGEDAVVNLNTDGKIITAWPRSSAGWRYS